MDPLLEITEQRLVSIRQHAVFLPHARISLALHPVLRLFPWGVPVLLGLLASVPIILALYRASAEAAMTCGVLPTSTTSVR